MDDVCFGWQGLTAKRAALRRCSSSDSSGIGTVRDSMQRTGRLKHIGEDHIYSSIGLAADAFQARPALLEALPASTPEPG